ncbi:MAG: phosphoribosylformylglycinamidine synthase I [Planctomycetota bacterium]|nr:MAG: phosphoribosylformylglycinamidine synthase I [Planctomycetota bacterium]
MATPRVLVLRAPGTNCDEETAFAFEKAGGKADRVHINRLLEKPSLLGDYQIACVPGGFSYGDDVAAGKILAVQIRHHLAQTFGEFLERDTLLLGICNGFQVLLKSGILLPPAEDGTAKATLTWNDSGRYEDRWVYLRVDGERCVFLRGCERLYLPVAHAEGKFVPAGDSVFRQLEEDGRLVLRYDTPSGTTEEGVLPFPHNPNGSIGNVAGMCDASGRVLGLMPHPERHIVRTHHPRWTRSDADYVACGAKLFENAIGYFA